MIGGHAFHPANCAAWHRHECICAILLAAVGCRADHQHVSGRSAIAARMFDFRFDSGYEVPRIAFELFVDGDNAHVHSLGPSMLAKRLHRRSQGRRRHQNPLRRLRFGRGAPTSGQ